MKQIVQPVPGEGDRLLIIQEKGDLLCQDLLQPGEPGQTVLLLHLGLALDEGEGVVNESLGDAVVFGVDPLHFTYLWGWCIYASALMWIVMKQL